MPSLAAISKIDFPHKTDQQELKEFARGVFTKSFPEIGKMLPVFDNTEIKTRNLCKPLDYYTRLHTFQEQNREYIQLSLDYSIQAIEECLSLSKISKEQITDLIFVSSTGLATPGIDALIINKMRLNQHVNRMSIFGLGCGGGTSGYAKACTLAKANPEAAVLLVAVELCSLTFLRDDFSKSNFIGSSLFSDGVAACLILGDNHVDKALRKITFLSNESKLYYDSLDIMGWDFMDNGFKVLFSSGIPGIIAKNIHQDVTSFLAKSKLKISDIKNFIFHPGGKKILDSYKEALKAEGDFLKTTREVMNDYGNMSSTTVLYVLERFFNEEFENGYGLMVSMGPGFSCEMVLLEMKN